MILEMGSKVRIIGTGVEGILEMVKPDSAGNPLIAFVRTGPGRFELLTPKVWEIEKA